ncbi:hypothetical protein ACNKHK_25720 [Shigella flexneri]
MAASNDLYRRQRRGHCGSAREAVARYYQQEARVQDALREKRVRLTQQARTATGIRIEIAATLLTPWKAQAALQWCGRRWFVPH